MKGKMEECRKESRTEDKRRKANSTARWTTTKPTEEEKDVEGIGEEGLISAESNCESV